MKKYLFLLSLVLFLLITFGCSQAKAQVKLPAIKEIDCVDKSICVNKSANSYIKLIELKSLDVDGFPKKLIIWEKGKQIKSGFKVPNPVEVKNIKILSLSRNGTGWSVAIIWGDARRAYKRTLYFMFSNKDFLLHKIKKEDISFEKDSSKSYCKKMKKPISMKKIVLDDCLD